MRSALSQCRSMRTASVFSPRSTSQASNGPATPPIAFWWYASALAELLVGDDECAADDVGVAAAVLRRRVDDDVGAEVERTLQVGRGEGVVDDEQRAGRRARSRPRAAMSATRSSGFVGVSSQTRAVSVADRGPRPGVEVGDVHRRDRRRPSARAPARRGGRSRRRRRRAPRRGRRARAPRAAACPPRPAPTRTRGRALPRLEGGQARLERACGSGWRCGCTRSHRAGRRRRPARRCSSRRSAAPPRPWSGRGPARRGWPASRTGRSPGHRTSVWPSAGGGIRPPRGSARDGRAPAR